LILNNTTAQAVPSPYMSTVIPHCMQRLLISHHYTACAVDIQLLVIKSLQPTIRTDKTETGTYYYSNTFV
jgi:hypothetical protein